jgi:hypothetical protein
MLYRCPVLFGLPFSPMPRRAAQPALLVAGAGFLEDWLGLPVALMHEAGMVLIPYVILVALAASRPAASVNAVSAIAASCLANQWTYPEWGHMCPFVTRKATEWQCCSRCLLCRCALISNKLGKPAPISGPNIWVRQPNTCV